MAFRWLVALVGMALACSACGRAQPVDVTNAWPIDEDGLTWHLNLDVCPKARSVEESIVEEAASVTVEYTAISQQGDCGPVIVLSQPLGDRPLIDAFDGEPIPLGDFVPGG